MINTTQNLLIMKISELIKKLQVLQDKHGDNDLKFNVKDSYSQYGEDMTLLLKVGDGDGINGHLDWFGSWSGDGMTSITFYLKENSEGKKPKITFRK